MNKGLIWNLMNDESFIASVMDSFTHVRLHPKDVLSDHLICKKCGQRVEHGITIVSTHYFECSTKNGK